VAEIMSCATEISPRIFSVQISQTPFRLVSLRRTCVNILIERHVPANICDIFNIMPRNSSDSFIESLITKTSLHQEVRHFIDNGNQMQNWSISGSHAKSYLTSDLITAFPPHTMPLNGLAIY